MINNLILSIFNLLYIEFIVVIAFAIAAIIQLISYRIFKVNLYKKIKKLMKEGI